MQMKLLTKIRRRWSWVDLSTSRMKSIGVRWLIQLYEHLCDHPHHSANGFLAAGILQSLDAGKLVSRNTTADKQNADEEISSEDDYTSSEDDTESDNFLSTPFLLN